ncbi:nucleoside-diphosphate sugar epimerase/dehydratase [Heyndrickxia sporothermodurans]|uniref:nucleoside-diphosphate sugar epimerase/dehydratase n=1 Tax=Heyndrickxia sporothermodurans TaxID=46224 RepID=UPI002E24D6EF|nr:nucleoside-diphosphate sugar epimerase/dehydratase [Heyndrickxia sporothermodurans]MED3696914.1 nucleoside-diphosphate sugar epimerase/dehydratase [Heyndrickxia sporothermodurans]
MAYNRRVPFLVLLDSIIVLFAIFVGYFILNPYMNVYTVPMIWISSISLLLSHHFFATIYRLYQKAWEYASVQELTAIVKAVTLSIFTTAIIQVLINHDIYFRVLGLTWMMHVILIGGSRFSWRVFRDRFITANPDKKRTLVVGAGSAGTMVVRQLLKNQNADLYPIAFVDDDPRKYKLQIYGLVVKGTIQDIPKLVEQLNIDNIVIAIPSLKKNEIKRIYEQCAKTTAKTKIIPLLEDLITGKVSVNHIRDVQVEDLLGRDPVELDMSSISKKLTEKTVLVTGAGGSIGSEICRQICSFGPGKLLLLGHGENSIYTIDMELRKKYNKTFDIIPIIADVQDRVRIFNIMEEYKPDVVYHAAAHKHVPLMEYNPMEAVKNNIFGTKNVAEAADTFGVKNFVLVSTDKAVNPPNVMGATKRFAEMIIQNLAKESSTKFVAVRFGNVLGSRGSVIPLFKKQILAGGPVTVTHPEMTRYFMTIPEASRLVIQAGALARGGEVFVLDMGEPVKIVDLAKNLITLSGYTEDEIGIEFSGIRPGEKLFEELLNENEVQKEKVFPKIHIGKAEPMGKLELYSVIDSLVNKNNKELKDTLVSIANKKFGKSTPAIDTKVKVEVV